MGRAENTIYVTVIILILSLKPHFSMWNIQIITNWIHFEICKKEKKRKHIYLHVRCNPYLKLVKHSIEYNAICNVKRLAHLVLCSTIKLWQDFLYNKWAIHSRLKTWRGLAECGANYDFDYYWRVGDNLHFSMLTWVLWFDIDQNLLKVFVLVSTGFVFGLRDIQLENRHLLSRSKIWISPHGEK